MYAKHASSNGSAVSYNDSAARKARALYVCSHQGALATLSLGSTGYPFGSVVTLAPDALGRPILLMSTIAEHTRNIEADPRVSLMLIENGDDAQESGRLTLLGSARRVAAADEPSVSDRYFRRFPHARNYARAHDFSFYTLEPLRLRYIGGFGHWLEPSQVCRPNPFTDSSEAGMVEHMNRDHAAALLDYCRLFGVELRGATPRLSGVDGDGFDLMLGKRLVRIEFDQPVSTVDQVRKAMVELVMRAREIGVKAA